MLACEGLILSSIKVFSIKVTKGTIITKWEKYKTVLICPNSIKGDSTCFAPNCIKTKEIDQVHYMVYYLQ